VDINGAIELYSHAGGNRLDRLQEHCDAGAAVKLAEEISNLQEGILTLVRSCSGPDALTRLEIHQVARQYLAEASADVTEDGLDGLLRDVIWIAWHDGWLISG
jgi:hypothetical protein